MRLLVLITMLLSLPACRGPAPQQVAADLGFNSMLMTGDGFEHRVYQKPGAGKLIHFYIEGDGRPWLTPARVSLDPTTENPVMLKLMALDPAAAVYLGRPCYMGVKDERCNPRWWTSKRYADEVVQSLNALIDQFVADAEGIALFGHSGGGTLAMLLAGRRSDVRAVVTVAGNLDIHAWTAWHGYSPLTGSLNPAEQPPLATSIEQIHLLGSEDRVITPDMNRPALAKISTAELLVLEGHDHTCCWAEMWPQLLEQVSQAGAD